MQRILAALLLGPVPLYDRMFAVSPWLDARPVGPVEPVLEGLEAQRHRRFIKSHLAADGLRFFPQAKYIVVGRDTRDVFMSMFNHYSAYTDAMYAMLNDAGRPGPEFPRCPATPRELWPRWITEGWFEWEADGWPWWSHHHHASTWWEFRGLPNVLLVHFADLKADLEAEMRRVAAFCEVAVEDDAWPSLMSTVGLDAMRSEARGNNNAMAMAFEGGADGFFFKGTNGRWRGVLTDADLGLYEARASSLDPQLRLWIENGRHAVDL